MGAVRNKKLPTKSWCKRPRRLRSRRPSSSLRREARRRCRGPSSVDTPTSQITVGIANTFALAAQIFEDPQLAATVRRLYGIFPAFSGLGYALKGSANDAALTDQEALRNAIAPEYLVKNVSFPEGNCRCIIVRPYPGRSLEPIDLDFVWREGGTNSCRFVNRLGPARP